MANSNTTNISIRMDNELKTQAEALFSELGMNMSTAFNIFVRQAIRTGGIPFSISLNQPNEDTMEAIREVQIMKADPSIGKTYNNVDEMMEELLSDV